MDMSRFVLSQGEKLESLCINISQEELKTSAYEDGGQSQQIKASALR